MEWVIFLMRIVLIFWMGLFTFAVSPTVNASDLRFVNRAPHLGIEHIYQGGWSHFVGGGVAAFDCNGDYFPDLFLSGGEGSDRLLVNQAQAPAEPLNFQIKSLDTGPGGTIGAYPLDLDNDENLDLFILKAGQNRILKGMGDCQFKDISAAALPNNPYMWSTAFSATWEQGNAYPTLAIGNYVDTDHRDAPFGTCEDNQLYRPTLSGSYADPYILSPGFCALSILFSDWARQGRQDLRISNDRHYYVKGGSEQLWKMGDIPSLYAAKDGWKKYSIWGMGIASRDITGDGLAEVYLTSMGDQKLHTLASQSRPDFKDSPYERGITAHRPYAGDDGRPSTGWHAEFADIDNDGLDDLFIAKGNVDQMPDAALADPNNLLIQQKTGDFVEVGSSAGVDSTARGRGAAVVDLNLDGRLDLVVVNRRAPAEIYENISSLDGNFLLLEVRQKGVNSRAVGAWIEVAAGNKRWHREITIGGGHAGGQSGFHHFGVGPQTSVRLRLHWPDGNISSWQEVTVNSPQILRRSATDFQLEPLTSKSTD